MDPINRVKHAACSDHTAYNWRPECAQVVIRRTNGTCVAMATDGHRGAICTFAESGPDATANVRLFPNVHAEPAEFPPLETVIAETEKLPIGAVVITYRKSLMSDVKGAGTRQTAILLAALAEKEPEIRADNKGRLTQDHLQERKRAKRDPLIALIPTASGEIVATPPSNITGPTDHVRCVNARYLTDALKACRSERVRIQLRGPTDPLIVEPVGNDGFKALIMPYRL